MEEPEGGLQYPVHIPRVLDNESRRSEDSADHWADDLMNSTSEQGLLWGDLLHWVNQLYKNPGRPNNAYLLRYLRQRCELVDSNQAHREHYESEFRRLNITSDSTFVRAMYTAVFRQSAGLNVSPHHLYGVDLGKRLAEKYRQLKETRKGGIARKLTELMFEGQHEFVQLILKDDNLMQLVFKLAVRVRIKGGHRCEDYYVDKLRRITEDDEKCHFRRCPFCGAYSALFFILSELHHLGKIGEATKQQVAGGRPPSECDSDELRLQQHVMAMVCPCMHAVATHLMVIDPRDNGHDEIPARFVYVPSDRKSSFAYGMTAAINDLKRKLAHSTTDADLLRDFLCAYDCHHPFESFKVVLKMPGHRSIVISLGKLIEMI
jgi:hypothetical protein